MDKFVLQGVDLHYANYHAQKSSALDPISTSHIEELVSELKQEYTIVMVTHNMQQAMRVSNPEDKRTHAYITGRFG